MISARPVWHTIRAPGHRMIRGGGYMMASVFILEGRERRRVVPIDCGSSPCGILMPVHSPLSPVARGGAAGDDQHQQVPHGPRQRGPRPLHRPAPRPLPVRPLSMITPRWTGGHSGGGEGSPGGMNVARQSCQSCDTAHKESYTFWCLRIKLCVSPGAPFVEDALILPRHSSDHVV